MQYQFTPDPNVLYPDKRSQEDNPLGRFTPITYPMQTNANLHSFKKAFNSNAPMIEKQNFQNQNNVYHNNISNNVEALSVVDYTIDIDSKDRDTSVFQDPFKYNVTFAPVTRGVDTREEWVNPADRSQGKHMVTTVYNGNPPPYIGKSFKNVKYIRVDSVQLPKYSGIIQSGSDWIMDTSKSLIQDRYIVMKLSNIDSRYNLSTNNIVDSNGVKLIPDTVPLNSNFYYAVPANANNVIKTFNMSLLGNVDRLYIDFYDSLGNKLRYNDLDATQSITDVRNPNNVNLQNNITLIFGIVENELATEVKFSQ